ncbi:restriction endonuclease subunit S [Selenomonas sp. AE3005]|uniref:restriction endonuclease subunit S n=1 Tax=Selenomonas sp. AE3005 TaxID=1485543 RepID=UPI000484C23C|nr:restriction endonuclease subunit S [Selenomonas sp. AE3005]
MAKKQQTIEEKLQAALVPVEEQPYKVPENWCWVRLGRLANVKGGKRVPKGNSLVDEKTNHPYIRVTDFQDMGIDVSAIKYIDDVVFEKIKNYTIARTDIYISIAGSIGKVGIIPEFLDGANLTENAAKITNINGVTQKMLLWYLTCNNAQNQMIGATISTTQPKLALFRIENISVPLPPCNEQYRIVARIESLFAKLDEAKEKIQEVLDGADLRRAAILHQAFTGKLTEKWRRENGVSDGSWDKVPLGNVIELLSGQDFKPTDYNDAKKGIPYITGASNFDDGVIINRWTEKPTVIAKRDDILLVCKGSGYGKTIIADFEQAHIARQIMALRVKEGIINKYVLYFLMDKYDEIRNSGQGLIPGISRKVVLGMNIFKISMPEQQEIVRLLDNLLSREQSTVTACEEALTTIDTLKKSILARAFRGELGTNDHSEASAKELLQEILAS